LDVRESYVKQNPYHNFKHAFDVTQTLYVMLTTFGAATYLTPLEILSLLVSAICHDSEHPGFNNAFLINTDSSLAITYNDVSVLENHHSATTFRLLQKPANNFVEKLDPPVYREFRKAVIENILATDTSQHSLFMSRFQQRLEHFNSSKLNPEEKEDRYLLCRLLIKAADISNVAKPWVQASRWSNFVSDEFFAQGDEEKRRGLNVAPFMDRTKSTAAKNTANFIDFLALPLFKAVVSFIPLSTESITLLSHNRKELEELIKSGKDIPRSK